MSDNELITTDDRSLKRTDIITKQMSDQQLSLLTGKTPEYAIKERIGRGNTYRYIPHGYVIDTLNKLFGPAGWDWELLPQMGDGAVYAMYTPKKWQNKSRGVEAGWVDGSPNLAVMGRLTIRVHTNKGKLITTIVKTGNGSQIMLPGMEFGDAIKGADSDAIKRAAHKLGIGNDLYWDYEVETKKFEAEKVKADPNAVILSTPPQVVDSATIPSSVITSTNPTNFMELLIKSMTDLHLSGDQVLAKLNMGMEEIEAAFAANKFNELWDKLSAK